MRPTALVPGAGQHGVARMPHPDNDIEMEKEAKKPAAIRPFSLITMSASSNSKPLLTAARIVPPPGCTKYCQVCTVLQSEESEHFANLCCQEVNHKDVWEDEVDDAPVKECDDTSWEKAAQATRDIPTEAMIMFPTREEYELEAKICMRQPAEVAFQYQQLEVAEEAWG
jgi:hypothetical protein